MSAIVFRPVPIDASRARALEAIWRNIVVYFGYALNGKDTLKCWLAVYRKPQDVSQNCPPRLRGV